MKRCNKNTEVLMLMMFFLMMKILFLTCRMKNVNVMMIFLTVRVIDLILRTIYHILMAKSQMNLDNSM